MAKNIRTAEELKILDSLAEGSNKFAIALYRAISKNATNNVIVSPVSLQLVLALAYCGAKGRTASEISEALGLSNLKDVHSAHQLLIKDLQHPVLKIANKMFLDGSFKVLEGFQSTAKDYFLAPAESCDFQQDPEKCRKIINSWVEENTGNKIKDLLPPGIVNSDTKLVLTNAVHFKADWKFPFEKTNTRKEPFHVTPSQQVMVDMMHLGKSFRYKHSAALGAKILELPYEKGEFRMIVILPDKIDGLSDVEDKLLSVSLVQEISGMQEVEVNLALPRFKFEETIDVNPILKAMGITTMFEAEADFSGISESGNLCVSQVVQKAFIDVNEKGTEAAAATALVTTDSIAISIPFQANHPFLLVLTSGERKNLLFIGAFRHPSN